MFPGGRNVKVLLECLFSNFGTCGKEEHPRLGILAKSSLRLWRIENCQGKRKMKHSAKCNDPVQKAALEEHAVQLL